MTAQETNAREALRIERTIQAPRERVFRAWTEPGEIMKWWGPEGCSSPAAEVELRVGGRYRITMTTPESGDIYSFGEYLEVSPPEKLVFTWTWEGPPEMAGVETLITIELAERGGATGLTLIHERFPTEQDRKNHEWGWNSSLDCLEGALG